MSKHSKGVFLSLFSASLWGIGGNIGQYIFQISDFTVIPLVYIRLLLSGIIILLIGVYVDGYKKAIPIFKDFKTIIKLIIYSIVGMLGVQLPFFATIQYSTAPFATLMQFWSPLIVMLYVNYVKKTKTSIFEIISAIMIFSGVFLIVTNGSLSTLVVDIRAIFWGVITAFTFAFYIVYAEEFFEFPTTFIMGFSMIIAFIAMHLVLPSQNILGYFINFKVVFLFTLLLIFGTVIPFYFFVESCRYISPKLTCLLSVAEPLVSLLVSIVFLNEYFGSFQFVGVILIITSILIITFKTQ